MKSLTGCIAGALKKNHYIDAIRDAGFEDVRIVDETIYPVSEDEAMLEEISNQIKIPSDIVKQAADNYVSSIKVFAVK